ncbi:MAG TPA: lytic transglycosylase domain-containing protein [Xanthobacteraceae bacterium]|nr:lytic transglycosylase domain-containing protein [Xanthobacteraceae bacterium]
MPVTLIRLSLFVATLLVAGGRICAAQTQVPLPQAKPAAIAPAPKAKATEHKATEHKDAEHKATEHKATERKEQAHKGAPAPLSLSPGTLRGATTASVPNPAGRANVTPPASAMPPAPAMPPPLLRSTPALAMATSAATSPLDLNALKQALDLVGKSRSDEAANLENSISDPLARKLIEWLVLRSDDTTATFARYAAFIAANPSWPSIVTLRRRAEAMLWQERSDPTTVLAFFKTEPPHTAKGKFALARALLSQGDSAGAHQAISDAWRSDAFSGDLEAQVRDMFAGLITAEDDKARMDGRLYAEDDDAGLRAAHHLDGTQLAIAKARAAVINKAGNAKALLEAVPAAAQHDAGYIFSRAQWLRRNDKIAEAGRWMIGAPHDPAVLGDLDQWWVERRLLARKLLDLNENKMAYEVANGAAPPPNENNHADQQFTAGWIALRFLHEPAVALTHFARIAEGVSNPITLARSFYWQGRAAEAAGHEHEARTYYESAARFPIAYYGQLARARLDLDEVTLRPAPTPSADLHGLEVARLFEMLYAVDARDVVAAMAGDLADKANDPAALAMLAEITKQHNDARATLLIGKTALGRGFPLEQYAFPDFGVPDFQPIGPDVARYLVYSIARQESAFNPKVVSGANAYGLMQVTPPAARDTAKRFNVTFDQRRLANDPTYNAQLGSAELGNDLDFYRGSYILAFVAYNAGRGRARDWIAQYGDPRDPKVDPIDWIERIPISETRFYIQRVLENMQVYRARFDNGSRLLIDADLRRGS